jgi:hypothetical protein
MFHDSTPPSSHPVLQNGQCIDLFPVPLPKPGFYETSLTNFSACVPVEACPGVDAGQVSAAYAAYLAGGSSGALGALLSQFWRLSGSNSSVCAPSLGYCCSIFCLPSPSLPNHSVPIVLLVIPMCCVGHTCASVAGCGPQYQLLRGGLQCATGPHPDRDERVGGQMQ